VTPKTIEWHLGRIYGKLGVRGRRQLATVELDGPSEQVQQL
jgi:DNA-binding CsgD family transcriptional regulator